MLKLLLMAQASSSSLRVPLKHGPSKLKSIKFVEEDEIHVKAFGIVVKDTSHPSTSTKSGDPSALSSRNGNRLREIHMQRDIMME